MLSKLLSTYISHIKGETYQLDPKIPSGYLIATMLSRIFMRCRGKLAFPFRANPPFIGRNVTLKVKSKIAMGASVSFGNNSYVDALSVNGILFGSNVSIGSNTKIECTGNLRHLGQGLTVGDNVGLGSDNFYGCAGGITIGSDTIVGNFVSFHAENHNFENLDIPIRLQGVTHAGIFIGANCWIGAKATILDGTILEDGCIIAAGAVVKAGRYKRNCIYGGVPAKLIKERTK